jgi:integrase
MAARSPDGVVVVATPQASVPYAVVDAVGREVEPVAAYLADLTASDCSPLTIRAYAFDLQGWLRFLAGRGVAWDQATRAHVRDHVLWLRSADNPYRAHTRPGSPPAGSVNARTGKPSLGTGYAPATINHRLAVVGGFYEFHRQTGRGPAVNPVPAAVGGGGRRGAHHNAIDPWVPERRSAYRQRMQRRAPRAIPDDLYQETFAALTSNRDRAMVSLLVSSGARAAELLAMTGGDVDWGRGRVRLVGKGSRQGQWVAASPDFFTWLARYLTERGPLVPGEPLWLTLRGPARPLGYQALRAVLVRVNAKTGANLVLHDFRHTCALRLASDPAMTLVEVQTHLRHRHLSSTEVYLVARPEEVIAQVQAHQRAGSPPASAAPTVGGWRYAPADLELLLGEGR